MSDRDDINIEAEPEGTSASKSAGWLVSVVGAVVLLAIAGGVTAITFSTEPTAQKEGATKKSAMLVDVVEAKRGDYAPEIVATGTVVPEQDVQLRPQVSGRVIWVSEAFAPGGFVKKGERLVRLETADFKFMVAQREGELSDAMSELTQEKGRQRIAKKEASFVEEPLSEEDKALVLRKPQIQAAEKRVEAAKALVEQAKVDLERTTIRAPFDAHIIDRHVNVGSQVSTNDPLGQLVGVSQYWVQVEVPLAKRKWIEVPRDNEEGETVTFLNRTAWAKGTSRDGKLTSSIGALDRTTRMARLIATVDDPLSRNPENESLPPLTVGEFLEVTIPGRQMTNVVRLNREHVRAKNNVWVKSDGKLKIVPVEVVFQDAKYAYISDGLEDGDLVVTTNLATVVPGAELRLRKGDNE